MAGQTNRQIIAAFAQAHAALAEDVVLQDHAQGRTWTGREAVEALICAFFVEGFPDARTEAHCIVADDRSAVLEFTFRGRQDGPFLSLPPTGREVVVPMALVCQIADELVWRANLYYDAGSLLRQLGLAPIQHGK